MALGVVSRLGHYDVTALIGEGGMGQVYQATDSKLNRQVALKILPASVASDPDQFERARIAERVAAGLARARRQGKNLGRPRWHIETLIRTAALSSRSAAKILGVWGTTLRRLRVEASRFSSR